MDAADLGRISTFRLHNSLKTGFKRGELAPSWD